MISFNVNNGLTLSLNQSGHDKDVTVTAHDGNNPPEREYTISNGDFVMLLNFFRYVKDYDIQNDFINPYGKNTERDL